ncbi:MAG: outer membrane lipoprotein chaperone LolA [Alphaproteobacteria bacterium]|nr:outer membrane lipoprotein chaperone LolA [Alphaproteobacteria bacterium]
MSRSRFPSLARLILAAALVAPALSAAPAFAQGAPPAAAEADAVVAGIEAAYKDVQSLQASFTQVAVNVAMGDRITQTGTVALARPRKMRWEFTGDMASQFVTDGASMWVYTPADNQVLVTPDLGGGGGGDGMDQLLESLDSLSKHFDISTLDAPEGSAALSLAPKAGAGQFKRLELTVDRKDYTLQKLVVVDPFDNRTELTFADVQKNATFPDGHFTFQIPDGATVVNTGGI